MAHGMIFYLEKHKGTYNIGVIVVVIHGALDLPTSDVTGSSDPYVCVSFSRFGKPL
jgi:Ca2+-dependent lipid-binding protein